MTATTAICTMAKSSRIEEQHNRKPAMYY